MVKARVGIGEMWVLPTCLPEVGRQIVQNKKNIINLIINPLYLLQNQFPAWEANQQWEGFSRSWK